MPPRPYEWIGTAMDKAARALVVDASAAVGILAEERPAEELDHVLRERTWSGAHLLVPGLFWLEVVNALGGKYRATPDRIVEAIAELDAFGLETVELDRPMLLLILDAVSGHGLTAYDATYLVLAESAEAELLTLDGRLAAAAGDRAIQLEAGHAIGESDALYGASADHAAWADWPGAAGYLRELRARVRSASTI